MAKMGFEIPLMTNGNSFWASNSTNSMANAANKNPMVSEPESPINIFAGLKLNRKKPNKPPANENDNTA